MKKEIVTLYICDFCGTKHEDEEWMRLHQELCPLNPKNQPCATCCMQILGVGCAHNMDMERIGGKVKCFFYKEGMPVNPKNIFSRIDGNFDNNPPENI